MTADTANSAAAQTIATLGGALSAELKVAYATARRAGELVVSYHGKEFVVERKAGDEPVTIADRESSELITAALADSFPGDVVISEESDDDSRRLSTDRVWFVDPIDGTSDFIRGDRDFCVMIGLVVAGRPVLGVVHHPLEGFSYVAASGCGAFYVDESEPRTAPRRLQCSAAQEPNNARVVVSKSHRALVIDDVLSLLGTTRERNVGSVGLKLGLLATGAEDVYVGPSRSCQAWDTAGPEAILNEAGGTLTDVTGVALEYGGKSLAHTNGLIAASNRLHARIIAALEPVFGRGLSD